MAAVMLLALWPLGVTGPLSAREAPPPADAASKYRREAEPIELPPAPELDSASPAFSAGVMTFLDVSAEPSRVAPGGVVTITLRLENPYSVGVTARLTDVVTGGLRFVPGTLTGPATYDEDSRAVLFSGPLTPSLNYAWRQADALPWFDIRGAGLDLCRGLTQCDDSARVQTFGQTVFRLYNTVTNTLSYVTNGFVKVGRITSQGAEPAYRNQLLPDPRVPNSVVAPFWSDLDMVGDTPGDRGHGSYYAHFTNTHPAFPGQPVNIVQWQEAAEWNPNETSSVRQTFQLVMLAGTDRVYAVYSRTMPLDASYPDYDGLPVGATVGVENEAGTLGSNYFYVITPTAPIGTFPAAWPTATLTLELYRPAQPVTIQFEAIVDAAPRSVVTNTATVSVEGFGTESAQAAINVGPALYLPIVPRR